VALERRPVVLTLVAEQRAVALARRAVGDEQRPVVMGDLVAEVPQDGAIRLAQPLAQRLAVRVVGLVHVERDDPVGVARRHLATVAGEQLEGQAALALAPALDRQPQLAELEEQPALGGLGVAEALDPLDVVVGRARAGEHAARAQLACRVDEPVAAGQVEVRAARGARVQGDELALPGREPEV
jgi:hypothetical protein